MVFWANIQFRMGIEQTYMTDGADFMLLASFTLRFYENVPLESTNK
tara:strand:- start:113093 stop:113230 length:138 start_codon:yes stop_codon:yes gene_type:complete